MYAASCRVSLVQPAFDHSLDPGGKAGPVNFDWLSGSFDSPNGSRFIKSIISAERFAETALPVTISAISRAVASVVSQLRCWGLSRSMACCSRPYGPSHHGLRFTLMFV